MSSGINLPLSEVVEEVGHQPPRYKYRYSIGTLVTDMAQYDRTVQSFMEAGFCRDDCQYLFIDNSKFNSHSAYSGLNQILNHASGEYIILCHQDVLLDFDKRGELDRRLRDLDALDPFWAVAGNAGGVAPGELAIRITDPHGQDQKTHAFPQAVRSLDENFIVLKSEARLAFSSDLKGFHFYGTDICILADMRGYRSYVIDFHLRHLSAGHKSPSFYEGEAALAEKYGRALRARLVQSTCALVYLTGNPFGVLVQGMVGKIIQVVLRRGRGTARFLRVFVHNIASRSTQWRRS